MPTKLLFPLALLLLCACSPYSGIPEAALTQPVLFAAPGVQATPEVVTFNIVAQITPLTTATNAPDIVATQIALVQQLDKSRNETAQLRQQLADQNVVLAKVALEIEAAKLETAKYNAAVGVTDAQKAEAEAKLAQALADKAAADVELEKIKLAIIEAEAEARNAQMGALLGLCVVALCAIGAIVVLRVLTRHEAQPVEPDEEPEPERTRPVFMDGAKWITPTAPPGDYAIFLQWAELALSGVAVSFDGMVGAGKLYRNNPDYRPLSEWAKHWRVTEVVDGLRRLSPDGAVYCKEAVARKTSPAPDGFIPESAVLSANAPENNAPESSREVVV